MLGLTLVSGATESNNATWEELSDHVLSKAKSGHVLLSVPKSYAPSCTEVATTTTTTTTTTSTTTTTIPTL